MFIKDEYRKLAMNYLITKIRQDCKRWKGTTGYKSKQ
jgi:hypothetical protein